ncbi:MAG TPA: FAD-binding oxidoreductase [Thermomicrobiaceae bacterium]|nr:FAD-binding oxidoreductase [Thermomicrobiaceae bacterium]
MEQADVVIVGAGIMGSSIANYLAERGAGRIVVLERDQICQGATADAAGGIRLQFSTKTNIELSRLSLEIWERFPERFGIAINFRQQGYLFLITDEAEIDVFRRNLAVQQRLGVPVQWLEPDEIHQLQPAIRLDDVIGGTYCPRDGWADTYSATMGMATGARRNGVRIEEGKAVTAIEVEQGIIKGVRCGDDVYAADRVILCTGPQTNAVGRLAGVDLPVYPYRRMSFITEPFDSVSATSPMTIDFASGLYFHPESQGFLFGMSNPDEPASEVKTVDDSWMVRTVEALCERAPAFESATVLRGWAGFYEITPDDNPILGEVDEVEGLYVAAGFSGHGFMQGPAIGMCIATLLAGERPPVDISAFRPSRFREGVLAQEHNVV